MAFVAAAVSVVLFSSAYLINLSSAALSTMTSAIVRGNELSGDVWSRERFHFFKRNAVDELTKLFAAVTILFPIRENRFEKRLQIVHLHLVFVRSGNSVKFLVPPNQIWYEFGPSPTKPSSAMYGLAHPFGQPVMRIIMSSAFVKPTVSMTSRSLLLMSVNLSRLRNC